jgi:hypothetical protein
MSDSSNDASAGDAVGSVDGEADDETPPTEAELRRRVEEEYDFDDFGPSDMAEMSADEWEAAFDPDSWVVGAELLDRVEADLRDRIASREVFAVLERVDTDDGERVVAYSDSGYAVVAPDGSVEGRGTVLRDVKPTVALCSMDSYEVPEDPPETGLPDPESVPEGTGQLGNNLLQVVAFAQLVTGIGLLAVWLFTDAIPGSRGMVNLVPGVIGLLFIGIAVFLFAVVANARLSDRFRAEEFRNRLRAAGVGEAERPDFLPPLEESAGEGDGDGDADTVDAGVESDGDGDAADD